jgi:hypothetical protein
MKWIDRYGDPRDPRVDAVDWVELIPFSETQNYVQRIMENLQVYRARFGGENEAADRGRPASRQDRIDLTLRRSLNPPMVRLAEFIGARWRAQIIFPP